MPRYDADLGASDPGTELRAIMTVSVSDIRMPADLLDRAVSRNRQRKARNRLAGAVGAAAAVAVLATRIPAVPGRSPGPPAPRRHTARLPARSRPSPLPPAAARHRTHAPLD